jgi:hypothetical protein
MRWGDVIEAVRNMAADFAVAVAIVLGLIFVVWGFISLLEPLWRNFLSPRAMGRHARTVRRLLDWWRAEFQEGWKEKEEKEKNSQEEG